MPSRKSGSRSDRVSPRSTIPPPTPTLSYVLLQLFNVWQEVRICSLLTRTQSNGHLSLSKLGWEQRGSRKPESKVSFPRTGLHRSCALCPRENSIRGLETQGPCTSEDRPRARLRFYGKKPRAAQSGEMYSHSADKERPSTCHGQRFL